MRRSQVLSIAVAGLLAGGYAQAAVQEFTATPNSEYTTPANWSGGLVPGSAGATADEASIGYTNNNASAIYDSATSFTTTGRFVVGRAGDTGTLTMNGSAGTLTFGTTGGDDYIGVDGGTGTLNANAGTLALGSANLRIGVNSAGANGTLNVGGGTITLSSQVFLGFSSGAKTNTGNLTLTTGSLTATSGTLLYSGAITINGGTFASPVTIDIGEQGYAANTQSFNMTAGIVTTNQFVAGAQGTTNTSTQSGGTLTTPNLYMGGYGSGTGTGTFSLSGTGTLNAGRLDFGGNGPNSGIFNLNGGTVTTGQVLQETNASGTGTVNFNGGTLQPSASSTTFMQGLTAAKVGAGAALINTNGFNITVAQPLLTGGGTDGGLTKSGSGTLALSGGNTYTGPTTITGGTLQIDAGGSLGAGSGANINVAQGAILDFETSLVTADSLHITDTAFGPELNLGTGDTATVSTLFVNGVGMAPGTYNAANDAAIISGSGSLIVTTATPEPASLGLLGLGALGLLVRRRRRA